MNEQSGAGPSLSAKRQKEIHESFDRRISKNEEWRLRMQGALQFAAFALGSGIATTIVLITLGVI